jgi:hypothetical protein
MHTDIAGNPYKHTQKGRSSRATVTASQLFPNTTGGNKVRISGEPYEFIGHAWAKDYQARQGEYNHAPDVSDPENVNHLF